MGCGSSGLTEEEKIERAEKQRSSKEIERRCLRDHQQDNMIKKLLLLGTGESGKSTLFKQLNTLYGQGYSASDRRLFAEVIHANTISSMHVLVLRQQDFEAQVGKLSPASVEAAEYILETNRAAPIDQNVAECIATLWADPAIQATWSRRSRFQIIDTASYFFERVNEMISEQPGRDDWIPTYDDVLRCRARTTGIVELKFEMKDTQFHIFDVGGQRNERKKWIHCFESVTALIFVVALSEYDQVLWEDDSVNRMMEALTLFNHIINLSWFKQTSAILFLNKRDLLQEKILNVDLKVCFPGYTGGKDYNNACQYIQRVFEKRAHEKKVYTHITCATDKDNVNIVFLAVQDIVIRESLRSGGLMH